MSNQPNPMSNQPNPMSNQHDDWLIDKLDELAKHPAQNAADHARAAARRAALINRASLYQLQAFRESQRALRWFNSLSANGGTWVGGVEAIIVIEASGRDLQLAQERIISKLAALFSYRKR